MRRPGIAATFASRQERTMFYVTCPECHSQVEIPANAIGPERTDLFNVVSCDDCGASFDYDDEEVVADDRPSLPTV